VTAVGEHTQAVSRRAGGPVARPAVVAAACLVLWLGAAGRASSQVPSPPTSVAAADTPADQGGAISITWAESVSKPVDEYRLYRRTAPTGLPVLRGTAGDGITTVLDPSTDGIDYYFTVRAVVGGIESTDSNMAGPVRSVDNLAPSPPTTVSTVDRPADNGHALVVSWELSVDDGGGVDDVETYRIYRSVAPGPAGVLVGTVAAGIQSYIDSSTDIANGTTYYYRVRASDGVNESVNSATEGSAAAVDNVAPGAPRSPTVADTPDDSGGQIDITWALSVDDGAGAKDVTEYRVYRTTTPGVYLDPAVGTSSAGSTTFRDTTAVGHDYYYVIRAFDGTSESASSPERGPVTAVDNRPIFPPNTVVVTDVPGDQGTALTLSWARSADAPGAGGRDLVTEYRVYRRLTGVPTFGLVATLPVATLTYTDNAVVKTKQYDYTVRASDGLAESPDANVVGPVSPIDDIPPATPTNIAAADTPSDNGKSISVTWLPSVDDRTGGDVTEYHVYRSTVPSGFAPPAVGTVPKGSTLFVDTTAPNGVAEYYMVRAYDGSLESSDSSVASATAEDNIKPGAVSNAKAIDTPSDTGGSITVSWTVSPDDKIDVIEYRIRRGTTIDSQPDVVGRVPAGVSTFVDDGLPNQTPFYYVVEAWDGTFLSDPSKVIGPVSAVDNKDLLAPTAVLAIDHPSDQGGRVDLSWTLSGDDGAGRKTVIEYHIYRRPSGGSSSPSRIGTVINGTTSFADMAATNKVSFIYTIRSYNGSIESADSNEAGPVAAADDIPPGPPSAVAAVDVQPDNGGSVTVSWARSADDVPGGDVVEYRVYRSNVSNGFSPPAIGTVAKGGTAYLDTSAPTGVLQYYMVRAYDATQESADSDVANAIAADNIRPGAPANLKAVDTPDDSGGSITLSWSLSAHDAVDVKEYRLRRGVSSASQPDLVGTVGAGVAAFVDDTVQNQVAYFYTVEAWDGSALSDPAPVAGPVIAMDNKGLLGPTGAAAVDHPNDQGGQIDLSWTLSGDDGAGRRTVTEYHIYRNEGAKGTPVRIGTVSPGINTFQDLGAIKDAVYAYTIRAYNGVIESADSNQAGPIASQDNIPPGAPRSVAAADQDPNSGASLVVSWTKSVDDVPGGDVVEYRVYRSVVSGGYSSPVGTVTSGQTGYTDTTAEGEGQYYFVVRAFDGSNESQDSNEVGPIVPVDSVSPEPATSVAAVDVPNDNGGSVQVTWVLSKDDTAGARDVVRYEVRRYIDPAGQAVAATGRVSRGETGFVDLGLVDGTPYYYAVFASDGVNSAASEIIGPVTSTDDIAPAAPAGLAAEAITGGQGTQIRLEWGRSPDDGGGINDVVQYDVFRARSATDFGSVLASAPAGTTTYVDEDALPNIAYYYVVKAADARNRSLPTVVAGPIQATDITPPATPTGLTSAGENGRVTLSWTASASPDVTGYFIYRSAAAGTSYRRLNGAPQRETRYVDESVTNGVTYTYRVSAVDSSVPFNESALTDAVSAVPRDRTPPDAPTGLEAEGANRQVSLKWAANTDQDLAGYNVYRSTTPDGSYGRMNTTVVTGTAYTDVQVVNGSVYYYRITAVDTAVPANESGPTEPVIAQPIRVFTLSLPAGAHMLGIPSTSVSGDPRATLRVSHDQWRLARWWKPDAPDASYHFADPTTLDADASFTPPDALSSTPTVSMPPAGIGYWIVLGAPGEVTLSGGTTPGGGYYTVRLYPGWNLVGNPWEGAMNWGAITTSPSNSIQPVGWQWDLDQGYVPLYDVQAANVRSQVAPLTSFWVYATTNCSLVLPGAVPVAASAASASARSPARPLFQGVSWKVGLSARAGQRRDEANWIGLQDGSASAVSRIQGPPPGAGYVDLYVAGSSGERLAADFRQSSAGTLSWDLRVESDIPNVPVDVLVPDLRELPRDWSLVLIDLDSGEEVFLRTTSTYRVKAGPDGCRRSLRLVAARDAGGGLRVYGLQAAAARRGGVSLAFQMTRAAATTVQVLNAAGRVVRTVESDQQRKAGAQELYWDGLADTRSRVPSGMYTVRIGARASNGERTQAVQVVRFGF